MSPKMWFRLLGLSCLLIAVCFVVPGLTQGPKGKKYALLVGVTKYESDVFRHLRYTENDVEKLKEILTDKSGGFDSVRVLSEKAGKKNDKDAPTASNIKAAIEDLLEGKKRGDTVVIAFSGHGATVQVEDPEEDDKRRGKPKTFPFFCPRDADLVKISYSTGKSKSLVNLDDVFEQLRACGAGSKLVLIDACRNELKAKSATRKLDVGAVSVPRGVAALFSCSEDEAAWESEKLEHGVFFHFVLEGLRGKAKNSKGEVTWARLSEYVTTQVSEQVGKIVGDGAKQTPHEVRNVRGVSPVLARIDAKDDEPKDKDGGTKVVKEDKLPKTLTIKDEDSGFSMEFVLIPATGEKGFMMGSTKQEQDAAIADYEKNTGNKASEDIIKVFRAEGSRHKVVITKPFYLGKYEVTQKQYKALVGSNPSYFSAKGVGKDFVKGESTDNFPVETASWEDAQAFLKKLAGLPAAKKIRGTFRLPTAAEWEYSCRGGPDVKEAFTFKKPSESISSSQANFNGNYPFGGADKGKYLERTCEVGSYDANPFGLYDMHGNVWEWCEDAYDENAYSDKGRRDPLVLKGSVRVIRGGCWYDYGRYCRSAYRFWDSPENRNRDYGFRAALVPSVKE